MFLNAEKWFFLIGTALMSVAPLYGAELTQAKAVDPLKRIFVGVPNQLTLPPTFRIEAATSPERGAQCKLTGGTTPSEAQLTDAGDARLVATCPPKALAASLPLRTSD